VKGVYIQWLNVFVDLEPVQRSETREDLGALTTICARQF